MKKLLVGFFALTFVLLSTNVFSRSQHPMYKIGKGFGESFYVGDLPEGFSAKKIEKPYIGRTDLARKLNSITKERIKDFKEYVLESGEYDYLSYKEIKEILKDPEKYFGMEHLLEIESVYKIYDDKGKIIGYVFEANDHVEAEMIQDGAWTFFYTDKNFKVIYWASGTA